MTELSHSATLVGLVQTTSSLPFVLFALPAGALADIVDRRRLLIRDPGRVGRCVGPARGSDLARHHEPAASAACSPSRSARSPQPRSRPGRPSFRTWYPRDELRSAIALKRAAVNVARAIGPAIAGLIDSRVVSAVFAATPSRS